MEKVIINIKGIEIDMTDGAIGVAGPVGNRTVVRPTTDGRFVVMTAKKYRIIKTFTDKTHARNYNQAIHR